MRQKFVSISFECSPAVLPLFFAYSDFLKKMPLKVSTVINDPFPMVKFFVIAK